MIDKLKELLTTGINNAMKLEQEYINGSLVMQGETQAYNKVLTAISELEKTNGDENSTSEEEKSED